MELLTAAGTYCSDFPVISLMNILSQRQIVCSVRVCPLLMYLAAASLQSEHESDCVIVHKCGERHHSWANVMNGLLNGPSEASEVHSH